MHANLHTGLQLIRTCFLLLVNSEKLHEPTSIGVCCVNTGRRRLAEEALIKQWEIGKTLPHSPINMKNDNKFKSSSSSDNKADTEHAIHNRALFS